MKRIYKYKVLPPEAYVSIPEGGEILCVQEQNGEPCIWVKVDLDAKEKKRHFVWIGTGYNMDFIEDYNPQYIGTIQMNGGKLVFHLFEVDYYGT